MPTLTHLLGKPWRLTPQEILSRVVVIRHGIGVGDKSTILVLEEPVAEDADRAKAAVEAMEKAGVRTDVAHGRKDGARAKALASVIVDFPDAVATLQAHVVKDDEVVAVDGSVVAADADGAEGKK